MSQDTPGKTQERSDCVGKIINIDEYKPQIVMTLQSGNVIVLPLILLEKFINGESDEFNEIVDSENILRIIAEEWLEYKNNEKGVII